MFGFCKIIFRRVAEKPLDNSIVLFDDRVEWHKKGVPHREDGPAVIWHDGTKEWYRNGVRHRDAGPAIERACGCCAWYLNGILMQAEGADGIKIYAGRMGSTPSGPRRCKFK